MDQTDVLRFMNSEMGRGVKLGAGAIIALAGLGRLFGPKRGGLLVTALGAGVASCGALDKCGLNMAFGLPIEGAEARAQLG